jgi:hypothetical protein
MSDEAKQDAAAEPKVAKHLNIKVKSANGNGTHTARACVVLGLVFRLLLRI